MSTHDTTPRPSEGAAPLVFMYSGQGSQYFDMGRELFDRQPAFRRWMFRCDEMLEPLLGRSLLEVLYGGGRRRSEPFDETRYTHPALFAFQWSFTQALREQGIQPEVLLGYSIGELVAATVAGALSLEDALEAVVDQARLAEARCPSGGMAAILQPPAIRESRPALFEGCELAAINGPAHFVVAGPPAALERLRSALTAAGVVCEILPIRFAFHSSLVDSMEADAMARAARLPLRPFRVPVVSSAYADFVSVPGPGYFWDVVRRPVRFDRSVALLESRGPHVYVDVGPSGTLANFVKYGLGAGSRSVVAPSLTPFGGELRKLDRLEKLIGRRPDGRASRG